MEKIIQGGYKNVNIIKQCLSVSRDCNCNHHDITFHKSQR